MTRYNKFVLFIDNKTTIFVTTKTLIAMRMYTRAFNKMSELNKFVNENGIQKDNIVSIFQSVDETYLLVYYGE